MSLTKFPPETVSGTTTSWIPLTTPWTIPSSCSYIGLGSLLSSSQIIFANTVVSQSYPGGNVGVDVTCQPIEVLSWWVTYAATPIRYSIAPLLCPGEFTTAKTSTIAPGIIQVACCPTNYTFVSWLPAMIPGQCTSRISSGQVVTHMDVSVKTSLLPSPFFGSGYRLIPVPTESNTSPQGSPRSTTAVLSSSSKSTSTSTSDDYAVLTTTSTTYFDDHIATALHINGRAFVNIPTSTSLPTTLTSSPIFAPAGTTTSLSTSSKAEFSAGIILSYQAIIAISFGISIAFLGFITFGVWIYRVRRQKHILLGEKSSDSHTENAVPRALRYRNELPGEDQIFEVDGRPTATEIFEEKGRAHELCAEETAGELP